MATTQAGRSSGKGFRRGRVASRTAGKGGSSSPDSGTVFSFNLDVCSTVLYCTVLYCTCAIIHRKLMGVSNAAFPIRLILIDSSSDLVIY